MKILTKYLGKTIFGTISLVIFALFSLEIFIEFTHEFPDIGTGYYGLLQMFAYVPLILPAEIYKLFPMAGLLGCLIGLGLLASHSELIVMRTSGMSIANITTAVIKTALLITLIMTIIGEFIAPKLQNYGAIYKTEAINSKQVLLTTTGLWLRNDKDFIHINEVLPQGSLEGITRYSFDNQNQLQLTSFAKTANYDSNHEQWIFNDVTETSFNKNATLANNFKTQEWNLKVKPKLLDLASIDTNQESLFELHSYIKSRIQGGLDAAQYQFTFWQRVFQPIATLVMILIAIPFIFGPLRSATMGLRILAGAITGITFHFINQFAGPMTMVYQFPPIIAAILPTALFAFFGCILIIKAK